MTIQPRTLKGFRDYLPETAGPREWMDPSGSVNSSDATEAATASTAAAGRHVVRLAVAIKCRSSAPSCVSCRGKGLPNPFAYIFSKTLQSIQSI